MNSLELLQQQLERYINQTKFNPDWGIYFVKELVEKIKNMKIEIYSNDHNPPHFHVKSKDNSINATFRLDNCAYIKGSIGTKDRKRIEAFFEDKHTQLLMKEMWNKSKPDNKKTEITLRRIYTPLILFK